MCGSSILPQLLAVAPIHRTGTANITAMLRAASPWPGLAALDTIQLPHSLALLLQFLLGHGMDINCPDDTNTTPLHLAAWASHLQLAKYLVSKGALVTKQDTSGDQPLHWAATKGHTEAGTAALS